MVELNVTKKQFVTLAKVVKRAKNEYEGHVKYSMENGTDHSEYAEELAEIADLYDAVMKDDD